MARELARSPSGASLEIVQQAISLHLRFTLSLRHAEDVLEQRRIAAWCRAWGADAETRGDHRSEMIRQQAALTAPALALSMPGLVKAS